GHGGFKQLGGEILNQHFLSGGHYGQPATGVFQLTHVARPRQTGEGGIRFRMKLLGFHAQLAGRHLQEMARQTRDIFPTLAQRREVDADHVQTME
ncbi:hypothetical protein HR12_06035, partial [Microbacterium sp. SUBG005]